MNNLLEICVDSVKSAIKAEKASADRLELCENLIQGGVTPSQGKIECVIDAVSIPVRILIRPRAGNFTYSPMEIDIISRDIAFCASTNCEGIVIGALNQDGSLPLEILKNWKNLAGTKKLVFHRAFDLAKSPEEALTQLIDMKFDTVLTSGQKDTAELGVSNLHALHRSYGSKINILAGGGVRASNLKNIQHATGITHFHSSAKILLDDYSAVKMSNSPVSEQVFSVDENEIRTMKTIIHAL